jgi:hypothetical protein
MQSTQMVRILAAQVIGSINSDGRGRWPPIDRQTSPLPKPYRRKKRAVPLRYSFRMITSTGTLFIVCGTPLELPASPNREYSALLPVSYGGRRLKPR